MKKPLFDIAEVILTIILSLFKIIRYLWIQFCVRFLKGVCRIETPTYRKWWARRSKKLQKMLDKEHQNREIAMANA